MYGVELTAENFDELDARIKNAYKDNKFHLDILNYCGFERSILDKFDNPGSDNNHPDIFSAAFALEVGSAHRICWGCDVRTGEDSYGTVLAMRHALADALTDMVMDGAIDMEYAQYIARRILYDNPKELFKSNLV